MSPRRVTLSAMFAGAALIAAPLVTGPAPRFIWNASPSVPIGLYALAPAGLLEVGDLVAVLPPDDLATFLAARGYLPRGVPLLKRVLALPGAEVCRHGATVIAYDHAYGEAQPRDRLGRDLPQWQGCRVIASGEIFLMNWDAADSLDGRYFGPLPRTSITARVTPIWTDEYGDGRFRWRFTDPAFEP
jgi:conjugative transfer signal peptidase TraF